MSKTIKLATNPGVSGWQAILPNRGPQPVLDDSIDADYLVIGAGFAGLSAARRLNQLEPDAQIVILEACAVGEGPAGRNSGFMIDLPHDLASQDYAGNADLDRQQTAINRGAIDFAKSAFAEYHMPGEAMQCVGKTNAAASVKGMRFNEQYAKHLESMGEAHKLLDEHEMRKLTGISYYLGGLWTPGTAILQPANYISSFADGLCANKNIRLFENSAVTSLDKQSASAADTLWRAKTNRGVVQATKVILAVNGMIERFGYFQQRLMHVFTYSSMTRMLTTNEVKQLGGEPTWAFTSADPMGSSIRRISDTGGDRIMIRNRFTYEPSMEVTKTRMQAISKDHRQAFDVRFPMLKNVEMEYCWGGRLCLSRNNVFAAGEVEDGVFSACCQNGLGTAKGTAIGVIAAEQASKATRSLIEDYKAEEPPKKLLLKPLMYLGANGYMRWKEMRAGKDK